MSEFNFSIDNDSAIENLRRVTKRSSKAEVVRDALSVYGYLTSLVIDGEQLFVGKSAQEARELIITTLENIKTK